MNLVQRGQIVAGERSRQPDQGWPESTMHIGDFSMDYPTDQDVARVAHRPRHREDLVTLRVAPPAAPYGLARDNLGEVRNWAAGAFENDAFAADKYEGGFRSHWRERPRWFEARPNGSRLSCGRKCQRRTAS